MIRCARKRCKGKPQVGCYDTRTSQVLEDIIAFYLNSRDFNGFAVYGAADIDIDAVIDLVHKGLVQVVSDEDFLNPHIRPWKSRRSTEDQVDSLRRVKVGEYMACLYPTDFAMKGYDFGDRYKNLPYRQRMAEGKGSLELAYFRYDVLEAYRNDPRFVFRFNDYGVDTWLNDDLYTDESEPESDKTGIDHIGFAYDLSRFQENDPESEIRRFVCAFYVDLCKLNAAHQLRWSTYEVEEQPSIDPHPIWWGSQMGHWPDGSGPFERFFYELESLNTLFNQAHGDDLFGNTDRPDGFGWIMRPSQSEFDSFVHQLDKLLSDNFRHKAFDLLGIPRRNDADELLGTLKRLDLTLEKYGVPEDTRGLLLQPIREIRRLRQRPAHTHTENITDRTFVFRQASLLNAVSNSLEHLRRLWQTHPANKTWKEADTFSADAQHYWL